jgi:hypothetical protein
MKRRYWIFFVIILTASSCNYPGTPSEAAPLSTPTAQLQSPDPATPTAAASETPPAEVVELPTQIPTSTPRITLASPIEQPVNCRFGPDISYTIVGALNPGRQAQVIGKNFDITWLFVRNPSDPSTSCWLSVNYINVEGDLESLPVVGPPEIMVTGIKVSVEPPVMNVACDAFPQSVIISADIFTNGPSVVIWQWTASSGQKSAEKQLLFESGGVKTVQDYFQVDRAADYTIQVSTLLPNPITRETNFKVVCTP